MMFLGSEFQQLNKCVTLVRCNCQVFFHNVSNHLPHLLQDDPEKAAHHHWTRHLDLYFGLYPGCMPSPDEAKRSKGQIFTQSYKSKGI